MSPRKIPSDNYPHLRKKGPPPVERDPVTGRPSRRHRLISKALRRADRRWDLYAQVVIAGGLDGKASMKTPEWRLIIQNGRLLRGLRARKGKWLERNERLESVPDSPNRMSVMFAYPGSVGREFPGE